MTKPTELPGRQPEEVEDPVPGDLLHRRGRRRERGRAGVLVPDRGQPFRGEGGRQGAADDEAEEAAAPDRHRGARQRPRTSGDSTRRAGQHDGMRWYSDTPRIRLTQIVLDVLALVVLVCGLLLARGLHDAIAALRSVGADVAASGSGFSRTMGDIGRQLGGVPFIGSGIRAPFDAAGSAGSTLADAGANWQTGVERVAALAGWTVAVLVILFLLAAWLRPRLLGARRRGLVAGIASQDGGDELLALRALLARPRAALAVAPDAVGAWRRGDAEVVRRLAALELSATGVRPRQR